jgi:hypothetical protein
MESGVSPERYQIGVPLMTFLLSFDMLHSEHHPSRTILATHVAPQLDGLCLVCWDVVA